MRVGEGLVGIGEEGGDQVAEIMEVGDGEQWTRVWV